MVSQCEILEYLEHKKSHVRTEELENEFNDKAICKKLNQLQKYRMVGMVEVRPDGGRSVREWFAYES